MNKKLLLGLALILSTTTVSADPITKQKALKRAKVFLAQKGIAISERNTKILYAPRAGQTSEIQPYYIYNNEGEKGFFILSGDDSTIPILGYSASGTFDEANLPDNMRGWLKGIEKEMRYIQANNLKMNYAPKAGRKTTAPILKSLWGQDTPYNQSCPDFYTMGKSATGCVATAMAQAMYTLRNQEGAAKEIKTAIPSYTCQQNYGLGAKISVNGVAAGTKIDWENMRDTYKGYRTTAQKKAVADLMAFCGAAVKMEYCHASYGGSGALNSDVAAALKKYFGYSKSTRYVMKSSYTIDGWNELIYNEVTAGRPVLFGGVSDENSGHAFVVDGYNHENGLFHLNWGWTGSYNGEFALSALAPESGGTGAGTIGSGYNFDQDAIIGLDASGTAAGEDQTIVTGIVDFNSTSITASYINASGDAVNGYITLAYYAEDGSLKQFNGVATSNGTWSGKIYYQPKFALNIISTNLKDGVYDVVPVYRLKTNGPWLTTCERNRCVQVVVKNGTVKANTSKITAINFQTLGDLVANTVQPVKLTVRNEGPEYVGKFYLFASKYKSRKGSVQGKSLVELPANGTAEVNMKFKPDLSGTFYVWITKDEAGSNVIYEGTVQIANMTAAGPLYVSDITVKNEISRTFADGKTRIEFSGKSTTPNITVTNISSTSFSGSMIIGLRDFKEFSASIPSFPAGQSAPISGITFSGLEYDKEYVLQITSNAEVNDDHIILIPRNPTGIESASVEGRNVFTIYNLNGTLLKKIEATNADAALVGLPKGVYLVNGQKTVKQ
ncbi:MAG: C10 family peptidase [Prevotella sp.]|nr:C10 family peptidase [Prevotella sp.]MDY4217234.1 C10 family peptidase [Prevotella sp.]